MLVDSVCQEDKNRWIDRSMEEEYLWDVFDDEKSR